MGRITYIATNLTAFIRINSEFEEPIFRRPGLLQQYLRSSRTILNGRVLLQPVLVAHKRSLVNKRAWFCELAEAGEWFLGHGDSLYAVKLNPREIAPNTFVDAIHAARTVLQNIALDYLYLIRVGGQSIPKSRVLTVGDIESEYFQHEPPR